MTKRGISRHSRKIIETKNKKRGWKGILRLMQLRKHGDGWIYAAVVILILFGTLMIVSTNVGQTARNANVVMSVFSKQIFVIAVSYVFMWGANHIFSFRWFLPLRFFAFVLMTLMMAACFGFAAEKGAQAWIRIGPMTVQPGEFAKPFLIVMIASSVYAARKDKKVLKNFMTFYRWPIYSIIMLVSLLIFQRDLGTMFIVLMIFLVCVLVFDYPTLQRGKRCIKIFLVVIAIAGSACFMLPEAGLDLIKQSPFGHVATRIENAKNPYKDIYNEGYQPANSLYGIASSQFIGKGIGGSARKYGYLTQADNDYILAVTIEETGVLGFGLIVFLYGLIIYRLFYYAFKTNEVAYKIVLLGTSMYLFMHFFLNVGGVACLIPFTGVPLLFMSNGGSSLMAACLSIGLSQQCISQIRIKERKKVCE